MRHGPEFGAHRGHLRALGRGGEEDIKEAITRAVYRGVARSGGQGVVDPDFDQKIFTDELRGDV